MVVEKPYFMNDKKWYVFDEESFMYKLTEEAPEKAKKSYKEFYEEVNKRTIYGE